MLHMEDWNARRSSSVLHSPAAGWPFRTRTHLSFDPKPPSRRPLPGSVACGSGKHTCLRACAMVGTGQGVCTWNPPRSFSEQMLLCPFYRETDVQGCWKISRFHSCQGKEPGVFGDATTFSALQAVPELRAGHAPGHAGCGGSCTVLFNVIF